MSEDFFGSDNLIFAVKTSSQIVIWICGGVKVAVQGTANTSRCHTRLHNEPTKYYLFSYCPNNFWLVM
ncbi:MAG: hypothetical protein PVI90_20035 [Desulfobacteraceae bacterium]